MSDEKTKNTLTGPARLVAEIVARTGLPIAGADSLDPYKPLASGILKFNTTVQDGSTSLVNATNFESGDSTLTPVTVTVGQSLARAGQMSSAGIISHCTPNGAQRARTFWDSLAIRRRLASSPDCL